MVKYLGPPGCQVVIPQDLIGYETLQWIREKTLESEHQLNTLGQPKHNRDEGIRVADHANLYSVYS